MSLIPFVPLFLFARGQAAYAPAAPLITDGASAGPNRQDSPSGPVNSTRTGPGSSPATANANAYGNVRWPS